MLAPLTAEAAERTRRHVLAVRDAPGPWHFPVWRKRGERFGILPLLAQRADRVAYSYDRNRYGHPAVWEKSVKLLTELTIYTVQYALWLSCPLGEVAEDTRAFRATLACVVREAKCPQNGDLSIPGLVNAVDQAFRCSDIFTPEMYHATAERSRLAIAIATISFCLLADLTKKETI